MCKICIKKLTRWSLAGWPISVDGRRTADFEAIVGKCPAMKALEDLTPGGSEFVEDPKFCFEYIKRKVTDLFDAVKKRQIKNNQLLKEVLCTNDLEMIHRTCRHCHGVSVRTKMGLCSACGKFQ